MQYRVLVFTRDSTDPMPQVHIAKAEPFIDGLMLGIELTDREAGSIKIGNETKAWDAATNRSVLIPIDTIASVRSEVLHKENS